MRRGIGNRLRAGGSLAFDYYVDSVNGSDVNNGQSASAAFATISKLQTVLSNNYNGKRIGLARGSVWREQIGGTGDWGSNVLISCYGQTSSALPILDGADVVTGSPWVKSAGLVSVYEVSWAHSAAVGSVLSVWENGVRLRWVSSAAACDATAGTYYVPTVAGTPTLVQVHASDNGNPNSNGKTYEITKREWGLMSGEIGSGWVITGVHTKRTTNANGSLEAVNSATLYGCIAEDGWKHNLFIGQNSSAYNCIAWKADWPDRSNATMFVAFTQNGSGKRALFSGCVAVCDPAVSETARVAIKSITGFYSHTGGTVGQDWDSIEYVDCSAYGVVEGFSSANATLSTSTRCYAYDVNTGIIFNGSGTAYDCYVKEGPTVLHQGAVQANSGTVSVEGLRHWCFDGNSRGSVYGAGASVTVTVTKSVLARDPTATAAALIMVNGNTAGSQINSSRNIIYGSTNTTAFKKTGTGSADFNVYWPATIDFNIGASGYTSFALYKAGEPTLDQSSVAQDPLLVDPANGDFRVSSGSPATSLGAGLERTSVAYLAIPSSVELAAM